MTSPFARGQPAQANVEDHLSARILSATTTHVERECLFALIVAWHVYRLKLERTDTPMNTPAPSPKNLARPSPALLPNISMTATALAIGAMETNVPSADLIFIGLEIAALTIIAAGFDRAQAEIIANAHLVERLTHLGALQDEPPRDGTHTYPPEKL